MKLTIDAAANTLYFELLDEPAPKSKHLEPFIVAEYTEDDRLASIIIMGVSKYLGGELPRDMDLDLTPVRKYIDIGEVPDHVMAKVREIQAAAKAKAK